MSAKKNVLDVLTKHFDAHGWPPDVGREKLYDRATITTEEDRPGCSVVEIERHRAILGETYTKGAPMSAFETYYMRYAVSNADSAVSSLSERLGEIEIDIDDYAASQLDYESFSLTIEELDDGKYLVCESVLNEETTVSTLEETNQFVLTFADGFVDHFSEMLGIYGASSPYLDANKRRDLIAKFEVEISEELTRMAQDLWKSRNR